MGKIEDNKDYILDLYLMRAWSANRIAKEIGVSRQGVILALQSWGVNTSKGEEGWIEMACAHCGKTGKVVKSVAREKLEMRSNHFCNRECYRKWINEQLS